MTTANFVTLLDQPIVHRLSWTLVHSLWQLIAAALVTAALLALLRRTGASARYAVACAMLLVMLAIPIATFTALAPVPDGTYHNAPIEVGLLAPLADESLSTAPVALPIPPPPHHPIRLLPLFVPAYFAGILALSLLHLGGWIQVQRLRRSHVKPVDQSWRTALTQIAAQLRLRRSVQLLESTLVQVPAVVGLFQPVILLPTSVLTGLTPQQIKSILAHELAHVRRHDYLANLIQTAIETLLFYHPAVWWLSNLIRQEREHCCDDLAAAVCADRVEYAGALAAMEALRAVPTPRLALAARGVRGGSLLHRIRRLLDVPDTRPQRWPSLLAACAAIACVTLATLSLNAQAKDDADPLEPEKTTAKKDDAAAGSQSPAGVTPEDLKLVAEDYTIAPGDLLTLSVMDIAGPGKETARTVRVPASGIVRMPFLSDTDANGLTEQGLERLIRKKYAEEGVVQHANVSVVVVEARGQTFSILGQVNKPGQYPLHDPDFRLLNAIAQAEGTKEGGTTARIIRKPKLAKGDDKPRGRTMEVPLKPLLDGDLDLNVVIRAGDTIVVAAPKPNAVRIVVGKNLEVTYEGKPTTWEELPDLLRSIPQAQRGGTVLELAIASGDVTFANVLTAQARASQLVKEQGLASLSLVGIHPPTSKAGDAPPADDSAYISGAVERPGAYSLGARKVTLKQLVMSAGLDDAAREPRVTVIRRSPDGKDETRLLRDVPFQSIVSGRADDPQLQANDIVVVKDAAQPEPAQPDRPK